MKRLQNVLLAAGLYVVFISILMFAISYKGNNIKKRELQLSIELKELQIQKLHCEFKTERCPNG